MATEDSGGSDLHGSGNGPKPRPLVSVGHLLLGYLWMLEIRSQLTWHDKLASTTVVRGRPPGLGHEAGREER